MSVHVSIHDVSPAWADEIESALSYCHERGVKPALLVVPNFHGKWPLTDHPKFCARLRELQQSGHEIFLHGFFHRSRLHESSKPGEARQGYPSRFAWLFAQRVASSFEAEFRDVSRKEALERLTLGEEMFQAAGLHIDGFVPPAWAMPDWFLKMLEERGYRFTEDHFRIYDPKEKQARASLVLNYASRSPMRLFSTVAYCRTAKYARAFLPTRIAIHPADMRFNLLRHEVGALLDWGKGDFVERGSELLQ